MISSDWSANGVAHLVLAVFEDQLHTHKFVLFAYYVCLLMLPYFFFQIIVPCSRYVAHVCHRRYFNPIPFGILP